MGKLRFRIQDGDSLVLTRWVEETVQHAGPQSTAAQAMAQLRREHPHAAISIERDTIIRPVKSAMVRFRIDVVDEHGNAATFYSKSVPETDADSLRAQVESDGLLKPFVKKTLTRETVR